MSVTGEDVHVLWTLVWGPGDFGGLLSCWSEGPAYGVTQVRWNKHLKILPALCVILLILVINGLWIRFCNVGHDIIGVESSGCYQKSG